MQNHKAASRATKQKMNRLSQKSYVRNLWKPLSSSRSSEIMVARLPDCKGTSPIQLALNVRNVARRLFRALQARNRTIVLGLHTLSECNLSQTTSRKCYLPSCGHKTMEYISKKLTTSGKKIFLPGLQSKLTTLNKKKINGGVFPPLINKNLILLFQVIT